MNGNPLGTLFQQRRVDLVGNQGYGMPMMKQQAGDFIVNPSLTIAKDNVVRDETNAHQQRLWFKGS